MYHTLEHKNPPSMQFSGLRISPFPQHMDILEHLLYYVLHRSQFVFYLLGGHLGLGRVHASLYTTDLALDTGLYVVETGFRLLYVSEKGKRGLNIVLKIWIRKNIYICKIQNGQYGEL